MGVEAAMILTPLEPGVPENLCQQLKTKRVINTTVDKKVIEYVSIYGKKLMIHIYIVRFRSSLEHLRYIIRIFLRESWSGGGDILNYIRLQTQASSFRSEAVASDVFYIVCLLVSLWSHLFFV